MTLSIKQIRKGNMNIKYCKNKYDTFLIFFEKEGSIVFEVL